MFIALVRFPDLPTDRESDFEEWFAWSNQQLAGAEGLHSRRLLRTDRGSYCALVEHDSAATFHAMHSTPVVAKIQHRLGQIVPEPPQATHYEVVSELATGGCCADGGEHPHAAGSSAQGQPLASGHACCRAG